MIKGDGSEGSYRFTVLTERLIRYEWSSDGEFENRASTFAPWRYFDVPEFEVVDEDGALEIITSGFHLRYDKTNFTSDGFSVEIGGETWNYDGESYGDLGGTIRTLDTIDGRTELDPGVLSRKPYAVIDDSASMLFKDDGWIGIREEDRKDGYIFAYGTDYKAAIRDFYRLSGDQPLLPRFVFGNWWSRYHQYTDNEYLDLMDHFAEVDIPLTVGIVDMDWHLVELGDDIDGWTGYTWNETLFPDPEAFIAELHDRGLVTSLNDHPALGVRSYEEPYRDMAEALDLDPNSNETIEFDATSQQYMDAFFDILLPRFDEQGIDFWWIDWQQGTESNLPGVDPLWVLNHYHYLASQRNLEVLGAPLTFSRFGGPGSQRYPIGFSGDTVISWESLDFQPEFTATASNIGYGWWSHDIGGHTLGARDNELTARWVQLGCFSPILRLHSTSGQWGSKEPWLWSPEAYEVMRSSMILRHRLIPFLYTMNVRAHFDREPLVQPMYWNHPLAEEAYDVPNEFYFGPSLIVAPITETRSLKTMMGSTQAWLPNADVRYIDVLHPGLVYDGGRSVSLHRVLGEIPVLAPEGTILPLDASTFDGENGALSPTHIEIQLVVGADADFELVEEDPGSSPSVPADPDAFIRTPLHWDQEAGTLSIGPSSNSSQSVTDRQWSVRLLGRTTLGDGADAEPVTESGEPRSVLVELGTTSEGSIEVSLGREMQLEATDMPQELYDLIFRSEMVYADKDAVWNLVAARTESIEERTAELEGMGGSIDDAVKGAVKEIWFADKRSIKGGYVGFPEV